VHPLFDESQLREMTDDQLHKSHAQVIKRLNQSQRMGYADAAWQLGSIAGFYQEEINRRNRVALEKYNQDRGDLDSLIDIG
jgi:hypothetical protein